MKIKGVIFVLLSLLIVVFIFANSAQVSKDSTGRSRMVTELLIKLFVRDFDEQSQSEQNALIDQFEHAVRKLAHFSEYAALGFVLTLCLFEFAKADDRVGRVIILSVFLCCAYAVSDEVHQLFVPGRTARVTDVLIDTAGAGLASCIAAWLHMTVKKIRMKHQNRTA